MIDAFMWGMLGMGKLIAWVCGVMVWPVGLFCVVLGVCYIWDRCTG